MPASKSARHKSPATRRAKTRPRASAPATGGRADPPGAGDAAAEKLLDRLSRQLDMVMISRSRIQETLDEAAERGRVTRSDANLLVAELVKRGLQGSDEVRREIEALLGRGREGLDSATRRVRRAEPVDKLVRGADRARRTVGVGSAFPLSGYDELTARQVLERLGELSAAELRKVRDHERRHGNRKTVLDAVERALG